MIRPALLLSASLLLGACATVTRDRAVAEGGCADGELADYVGRTASARLGEELMQASGAKVLQWIQPGMMVTMDFRSDRLRVRLDANNKVLSANCG